MSNALSIATVTSTLRNLLDRRVRADGELADTRVTTTVPDKARGTFTSNQLNLFLFNTSVNAAWRNAEIPGLGNQGEQRFPVLPLTLHYLVTAYGRDDDDVLAHRLLGRAMTALHDHPVLGAEEVRLALPDNDLYAQVERVRITPHPLSLDDMSRLWTTFQTQYRLSASYEAAVVLMESDRPGTAGLPVLTRGAGDEGVHSQASNEPPFPRLIAVEEVTGQRSAALGDTIRLAGRRLAGATTVRLRTMGDDVLELPVAPGGTDEEATAAIPDDAAARAAWWAGPHAVSVVVDGAETNALPLAVAPGIASTMPMTVARAGDGSATVALTCVPQVRPSQRVVLIVGSREVVSQPRAASTEDLTFVVEDAPLGEHWARLRVDGIDSRLVDASGARPVFSPTQRVTFT